ncbi:T9SS type A sorting domain-containing protein [Ornithobacterium rhinotracheale]|uniref:T9SS type A sorting domain-containing protein n=1 Tax=Ornithobacterium rhinotracheale TaxID=28251 RepID=UPI004036F2FD
MKKFLLVFILLGLFKAYANSSTQIGERKSLVSQIIVEQGRVKVYPNPATDSVYIKLSENESSSIKEVYMYNLLGDEVYHRSLTPPTKDAIEINISGLKKGKYLIKVIFSDATSEVKPLIKR